LYRPLSETGQFAQGEGDILEDKLIRELAGQVAGKIAPYFYDHRMKKN
jgi:hypothetical protein